MNLSLQKWSLNANDSVFVAKSESGRTPTILLVSELH